MWFTEFLSQFCSVSGVFSCKSGFLWTGSTYRLCSRAGERTMKREERRRERAGYYHPAGWRHWWHFQALFLFLSRRLHFQSHWMIRPRHANEMQSRERFLFCCQSHLSLSSSTHTVFVFSQFKSLNSAAVILPCAEYLTLFIYNVAA